MCVGPLILVGEVGIEANGHDVLQHGVAQWHTTTPRAWAVLVAQAEGLVLLAAATACVVEEQTAVGAGWCCRGSNVASWWWCVVHGAWCVVIRVVGGTH